MIRQHRAFSLVELLFTLGILSIFALIAARLTTQLLRVSGTAQERSRQVIIADDCFSQLRDDVWHAASLSTQQGRVALSGPSSVISWTIASGSITRTVAPSAAGKSDAISDAGRSWPIMAKGLTFTADGPHLLLSSDAGEMRLTSETMRLQAIRHVAASASWPSASRPSAATPSSALPSAPSAQEVTP